MFALGVWYLQPLERHLKAFLDRDGGVKSGLGIVIGSSQKLMKKPHTCLQLRGAPQWSIPRGYCCPALGSTPVWGWPWAIASRYPAGQRCDGCWQQVGLIIKLQGRGDVAGHLGHSAPVTHAEWSILHHRCFNGVQEQPGC